ncbi:hypothetical protein PROFUN_13369 [Planoprotostelium fungivorum]|uniref:Uncharacterized protein n=1 Tax=Planoprotostelium fungivorum TaxID=1890364 RepID=A0A2P6MZS7_9EUKA|nr:hypothetical protein PROFUN_13369 [Planoprotostelium fungivorum]
MKSGIGVQALGRGHKSWSADGCSLSTRNFGYPCICSHLTNFTLGIQPVIQRSTTQDYTKWTTIIAGVVGGFLFVLTVVILLVRNVDESHERHHGGPEMIRNCTIPISYDSVGGGTDCEDLVLHSPVSISTVLVQSSREGRISKLSDFPLQGEHHHEMILTMRLRGPRTWLNHLEPECGSSFTSTAF